MDIKNIKPGMENHLFTLEVLIEKLQYECDYIADHISIKVANDHWAIKDGYGMVRAHKVAVFYAKGIKNA